MHFDIGNFSLLGAWLLTAYGLIAGTYGAMRPKKPAPAVSAERALLLSFMLSSISLVSLAYGFLRHDYRNKYIWQHSNNEMSPIYLISAVWGGMDGSLLLWAWITGLFSVLVIARSSTVPSALRAWLVPVLHGAVSFFLGVVAFLTNPFRPIPTSMIPSDGNGLNPLLQNPSMIIHPPSLYLGFTGLSVPFAFALAALLSGSHARGWIMFARRWTIAAWGFLTAGIILGGNWAYIELGWGGFWAWDPVENSSFLPWLSATALLHSALVEERRGMLKVWNIFLAILSYLLAVFGTFLTRSGVVQSVHAFAQTDIGWVFLAYIGVVAAFSFCILLWRLPLLSPEHRFESFLSREAVFLFNNLLLLAIGFATFWGVMFPVVSEALTGEKAAVGPPFFNQVNTPLFLILLLLMGIGPLLPWRKGSLKGLLRFAAAPAITGSLFIVIGVAVDPDSPLAALSFGIAAFVLTGILMEFGRAMRVRRELGVKGGVAQLVRSRPRYFGGMIVHAGVAAMAISITASMGFKIEKDLVLNMGEKQAVGRYELRLDSMDEVKERNYSALVSRISVFKRGEDTPIATLAPERRFYPRNEEVTSEVDIRMTLLEDLYVALAGAERTGPEPVEGSPPAPAQRTEMRAVMKVFVNPLQIWLWFGSVVMLFGTAIVFLGKPSQAFSSVPAAARESVEAQ